MFLAPTSPADIKAQLIDQLAHNAEWRRRVAQRFPEDDRNLNAAELCERLAARFHDLPESDPGLKLLFDAHHLWFTVMTSFEDHDDDDDDYDSVEQMFTDLSEAEDRVWREMGFHVKYSRFCVIKELAENYIHNFDEAADAVFAAAQSQGLDRLKDRLARLVPAEIDAPEASWLEASGEQTVA